MVDRTLWAITYTIDNRGKRREEPYIFEDTIRRTRALAWDKFQGGGRLRSTPIDGGHVFTLTAGAVLDCRASEPGVHLGSGDLPRSKTRSRRPGSTTSSG